MGCWWPKVSLVYHRSWKYSPRGINFLHICVETEGSSSLGKKIPLKVGHFTRISV
jgi:hypothetical protein